MVVHNTTKRKQQNTAALQPRDVALDRAGAVWHERVAGWQRHRRRRVLGDDAAALVLAPPGQHAVGLPGAEEEAPSWCSTSVGWPLYDSMAASAARAQASSITPRTSHAGPAL